MDKCDKHDFKQTYLSQQEKDLASREPKPLTGKDVFTPLTVDDLVQQRGSVYGHPLDDFGRVAKLKAVVADIKDPELRHAAEMVCVKLARLCTTPEHLDSWDDIGGYAKTGRMVIEERARRAKP